MSVSPIVGGGGAVVVAVAALVYRDAARVDVKTGSPGLWAALVAFTGGAGLATAVAVPDAPIPGVLVLVALGPLVYALEREDSVHGDDPADPTRLPSDRDRSDGSETGNPAPTVDERRTEAGTATTPRDASESDGASRDENTAERRD